jgi:uncharacterized protein
MQNLCMNPCEVDIVIYHADCSDGFGAATCAYYYFFKSDGMNDMSKVVEYYPASFNKVPPDVTGRNVLMCDFTYKYPAMLHMIRTANKLVVLDHHKSAQVELRLIPDENKIFDMSHSGAVLAWQYFFPSEPVPLGIQYIEDNNIWLKRMYCTENVIAFIHSMPFEFDEYIKLFDTQYINDVAILLGKGMVIQNDVYIQQALTRVKIKMMCLNSIYYLVGYVNSTILKSEIGNAILKKYPNINFSIVYNQDDKDYYFSLRSEDTRTDVSLIATQFGGGGHRNASDMSTKSNILPSPAVVINNSWNIFTSFATYKIDNSTSPLASIVCTDDEHYLKIVYSGNFEDVTHIIKYLEQVRYVNDSGDNVYEHDHIAHLLDCYNVGEYRIYVGSECITRLSRF